jgi:ATP synthase protein I
MSLLRDDTEEEPRIVPLTAEEARQLRERQPPVSPWRVIAGQIAVGLVAALAAWGITGRQNVGWSAAYGALAVAVPAAIFAGGLGGRISSRGAGSAAARFLLWEVLKIALTVAMLVAAPRLVPGLSWPALLVGLVLCVKVYWIALAYAPGARKKRD